jgi:predicted methyltransferase
MNKRLSHLLIAATFFVGNLSAHAALTPLQEKVKSAMKMEHRTEQDIKRDRNRDPVRALDFFGLTENMKVIEFAPGNGWYTKILAPVLTKKGELYLASNSDWFSDIDDLLTLGSFSSTKKLPIALDWNNKEQRIQFDNLSFGMTDADMLLNIREYHNFNQEDKDKLNKATFQALKPGGTYVIVDHSRRHMAPETDELGRREDAVKVILDVQAAGFILEKSSDMFYRPDDELRYEVGRKTVRGNTDRFTLVFKKPK